MGMDIVSHWHNNDVQKHNTINNGSFCVLPHFMLLLYLKYLPMTGRDLSGRSFLNR